MKKCRSLNWRSLDLESNNIPNELKRHRASAMQVVVPVNPQPCIYPFQKYSPWRFHLRRFSLSRYVYLSVPGAGQGTKYNRNLWGNIGNVEINNSHQVGIELRTSIDSKCSTRQKELKKCCTKCAIICRSCLSLTAHEVFYRNHILFFSENLDSRGQFIKKANNALTVKFKSNKIREIYVMIISQNKENMTYGAPLS